jgi:hypothetical protein
MWVEDGTKLDEVLLFNQCEEVIVADDHFKQRFLSIFIAERLNKIEK